MRLNKEGMLIIISGPSGVGKGTVKKLLLERIKNNLVYSVSMTTRSPRINEKNGKDYFFVSNQFFKDKIKENYFLEYNEFIGNYYGTPKIKVMEELKKNKDVLLEIDVQGALQISNNFIKSKSVFIFLAPPSIAILKQRIEYRNTESLQIINERISKARQELLLIQKIKKYDYMIINDKLDDTVNIIMSILVAERVKFKRIIKFYSSKILI
ncbi:MAG: guanylate kinase [Pigeon pea little leaf phytoplasma]|uniref:Guanylate kinase n=1 Tax=Candidatus Phytoplasma fabacearum TaxID=2982628 RepID=A0ABU8ZSK4_9MOLU|nr:guanylate kinase ['Bituminaria bituminosa' little leaf phytoplasma]MDV3161396.1 guanylate kinase [Pigeon pea little leaf phytoplasma]MDO7983431.1 guanylate kinase ['Bituminaria bituminosa' little leaf phytoplasma]MDV3163183.1 guanylate kinase [Pigeon pea little leaf phytoplasma]MDV3164282.1 guanylate kinase [Pigeon pea little leaf phytoplasma]MDV3195535.1 guanylate kinase [Pigeon pea little leaf phytoplasma]